ncbi:MAG: capsular biosynthesis protein [Sneathiella sp.]|nr:capsular biosynthesis protein [Sneathiella sp.]
MTDIRILSPKDSKINHGTTSENSTAKRTFLFLQGPISPFFPEIADELEKRGHTALRINLCFGDFLFWRRSGATNYRRSKKAWPCFIRQYLMQNKITDVILLGEQRDYHKSAIAAAKKLGITVVATDFGYLRPDWITLEKDGMSGSSLFPKKPADIRNLAQQVPDIEFKHLYEDSFWTMAVWDIIYHISSLLFHLLYPGYRTHQLHNPILVYIGTGLRLLKNKRVNSDSDVIIKKLYEANASYFVFPLQMATDFQIRAYSPYPDFSSGIEEVISSFAKASPAKTMLVIKIHPLDPGLVNWAKKAQKIARRYGLEDRIIFLHGGNLDRLLRRAKGVVTINSTVGLWALRAGCPVKILGQAIFDVEGLVDQKPLSEFWNSPAPPNTGLCADFLKALAGTIQIQGVFYKRPGLNAAVKSAAHRLERGLLNCPI